MFHCMYVVCLCMMTEADHKRTMTHNQLSESYRGRPQKHTVTLIQLSESYIESWSAVDKPSIPIMALDSTGLQ